MTTVIDSETEEAFFSDGPAGRVYESYRDTAWKAGTKAFIEELWLRFRPYCPDRHFLSDARTNFFQRTWEMYVASVLLDAGIRLVKPAPAGPDFQLQRDERTWIEAISMERGNGPDAVSKPETRGSWRVFKPGVEAWMGRPPSDEEIILRCTAGIYDKYKVRQQYVDAGIVSEADPFVIAVNIGYATEDHVAGISLPIILHALFELGDEHLRVPIGPSEEKPSIGFAHRPQITKKEGGIVGCDAFTSDKYVGLSGVLFGPTTVVNAPAEHGRELHFVHNPRATATLPMGTFPFGTEWHLGDDSCLYPRKHFQDGAGS